eukprot:INCI18813.1.p1 GENE.INCI18813.1~~INCI18813.1.p1  ORF type:complete len:636 (-),score=95.88 INCI18813.1:329-2236(-)
MADNSKAGGGANADARTARRRPGDDGAGGGGGAARRRARLEHPSLSEFVHQQMGEIATRMNRPPSSPDVQWNVAQAVVLHHLEGQARVADFDTWVLAWAAIDRYLLPLPHWRGEGMAFDLINAQPSARETRSLNFLLDIEALHRLCKETIGSDAPDTAVQQAQAFLHGLNDNALLAERLLVLDETSDTQPTAVLRRNYAQLYTLAELGSEKCFAQMQEFERPGEIRRRMVPVRISDGPRTELELVVETGRNNERSLMWTIYGALQRGHFRSTDDHSQRKDGDVAVKSYDKRFFRCPSFAPEDPLKEILLLHHLSTCRQDPLPGQVAGAQGSLHFPKLLCCFHDDNFLFKVEEWAGPTSLCGVIHRHQQQGMQIAADRTIAIIRQLATAIQHIHSCGFAHCDLCFSNVMYNEGTGRLYVIDFGMAVCVLRLLTSLCVRGSSVCVKSSRFLVCECSKRVIIHFFFPLTCDAGLSCCLATGAYPQCRLPRDPATGENLKFAAGSILKTAKLGFVPPEHYHDPHVEIDGCKADNFMAGAIILSVLSCNRKPFSNTMMSSVAQCPHWKQHVDDPLHRHLGGARLDELLEKLLERKWAVPQALRDILNGLLHPDPQMRIGLEDVHRLLTSPDVLRLVPDPE